MPLVTMAFLKLITLAEDIRYRVVVSRIIIGKHISVPRLKVTLTVFILKGKGNIRCLFGYRMLFSLFFSLFFLLLSISCCVEYFASTVLPGPPNCLKHTIWLLRQISRLPFLQQRCTMHLVSM